MPHYVPGENPFTGFDYQSVWGGSPVPFILSVPLIIEKIYKKRILPALDKTLDEDTLAHSGDIASFLLKKIRGRS